jgi:hypothetical protein
MDNRQQQMQKTIERLRREFAGDPNVHSIGIGLRRRGRKLQDEVCIRFLVRRKYQSQREIEAFGSRPVPLEVDGFHTDVDAVRIVRRDAATGHRGDEPRDPLVGGVATSNADGHVWLFNTFGTLGMICRDADGNAVGLSNWHVWGEGGNPGDDIIQPRPRGGDHLEGVAKVAACGPVVSTVIEDDVPSPLTPILYGAAAAAVVAAVASDYRDPTRRGQDATPTQPGERTLEESVNMAAEYPDLPWPGTPFRTDVKWQYKRRTDRRELGHEVSETQRNAQFLLGQYLTIDKSQYRPGEKIKLIAGIWDYQPRPCDAYHAVAHLIPAADPDRVLRAVLQPAPCPKTVPLDPSGPKEPGKEVCLDFRKFKPGQNWPPQQQFQWLSVVNQAREPLRSLDWYPVPPDGQGELYIPRDGLLFRHAPAAAIDVEIVAFNEPVTLTAFDALGNQVGHVRSSAGPGVAERLRLHGSMIVGAHLDGGGGEAVVLQYCIVPVGSEKVEVVFPKNLAEVLAREKVIPELAGHRRVPVHRCCFAGEITLPPSEVAGPWNAYLTVQNVNFTPDGTPPEAAATVIGGHVVSECAQIVACTAVMLADHDFDVI